MKKRTRNRRYVLRRPGVLNPYLYFGKLEGRATWFAAAFFVTPLTRNRARRLVARLGPGVEMVRLNSVSF